MQLPKRTRSRDSSGHVAGRSLGPIRPRHDVQFRRPTDVKQLIGELDGVNNDEQMYYYLVKFRRK